uniref:Uncharacterized protein n=2 Tax=Brassica TaxID=3705 RepID=A0A0D3C1D4_BRAOL
MGNGSLFFADLKLADVLSPWSSISGNSFEHHVTLMEATVECSLGQSPVEAIVCVESSRFLLTGYVNLEPLQTAIVGIIDFSNFCMNGKMDLETVAESGLDTYVVKSPPQDWLFIPYQHIRTKTNLRKLVTEEMLQSDGHNSIIIVDGANMIGWPEKMIDDELEIVRNAGVVQLQREIPHSINIQVAKALKRAVVPVI